MQELPSALITLHPGVRDVVLAEIILNPDHVAVFVLDDFDVAGAGDERLEVRLERLAEHPHDAIGIDPCEFWIDPLVNGRFVAFLEGNRCRPVGGDDFIVSGCGGACSQRGENAGRDYCSDS